MEATDASLGASKKKYEKNALVKKKKGATDALEATDASLGAKFVRQFACFTALLKSALAVLHLAAAGAHALEAQGDASLGAQ